MKLFSSLAIFILGFLMTAWRAELGLQPARGKSDDLAAKQGRVN